MDPRGLLYIVKAAELLWPEPWRGKAPEVYLAAIALQESMGLARSQRPSGPALSFWQIEPPTLDAVIQHPRVGPTLLAIADRLDLQPGQLREALRYSELFAASVARALLRSIYLPLALDRDKAWQVYLEAWRPGVPRPGSWASCWAAAISAWEKLHQQAG